MTGKPPAHVHVDHKSRKAKSQMDLVREEHLHKTHPSLLAEMIPLWVILGWHLRHDLLCSQEAFIR